MDENRLIRSKGQGTRILIELTLRLNRYLTKLVKFHPVDIKTRRFRRLKISQIDIAARQKKRNNKEYKKFTWEIHGEGEIKHELRICLFIPSDH